MRRAPAHPDLRESRLQQEVACEKQADRDADARALAEGRASVEELDRANGLFSGRHARLDYDAALRLW